MLHFYSSMVTVARLIWDEWNIHHIARHGVARAEVEEVCHGPFMVREGNDGRIMLIGPTLAHRMISVVLALKRNDEYYLITAYPASRRMRRIYTIEIGGEKR